MKPQRKSILNTRHIYCRILLIIGMYPLILAPSFADTGLTINVLKLAVKPVLDGKLNEWPAEYIKEKTDVSTHWTIQKSPLVTYPSHINTPDEELPVQVWQPKPKILAGLHEDRLYIAVQWHDDNKNNIYRPWKRRGKKFTRDRKRDDMFALRFDYSGDFSSCMMSGNDYIVDIWRWSAGRSEISGIADDMTHRFSVKHIESASIYPTPNGSVYFRKDMDSGNPGWKYTRRPEDLTKKIATGVELDGKPQGSRADVSAKAQWADGIWTLELSRKLETEDKGDIQFMSNTQQQGQIAIFNAGYRMRKQISPTLTFDFSGLDK